MFPRSAIGATCAAVLMSLAPYAYGAPAVDVIDVDLAPAKAEAKSHPERFAVDVAHAVDVDNAGEWTVTGSTAEWRYTVQIPGAYSMSFRAMNTRLPAAAALNVRAGDASHTYRAADLNDGALWSRILKG